MSKQEFDIVARDEASKALHKIAKQAYEVVTGLNYPTKAGEKRAEPGDVVTDLPAKSIEWLLEQGHIKPEED
jgi:hypothetical protein